MPEASSNIITKFGLVVTEPAYSFIHTRVFSFGDRFIAGMTRAS
jgi:hypothetical protein